jgi:hypothetical protein
VGKSWAEDMFLFGANARHNKAKSNLLKFYKCPHMKQSGGAQ